MRLFASTGTAVGADPTWGLGSRYTCVGVACLPSSYKGIKTTIDSCRLSRCLEVFGRKFWGTKFLGENSRGKISLVQILAVRFGGASYMGEKYYCVLYEV